MELLPEPTPLAIVVATRLLQTGRRHKYPHELNVYCPVCNQFPKRPVTASCGHTRCTACIKRGRCPCRAPGPRHTNVDVLAQDLLAVLFPEMYNTEHTNAESGSSSSASVSTLSGCKTSTTRYLQRPNTLRRLPRKPLSIRVRNELVRKQIQLGKYKESIPHLAILATAKCVTFPSYYPRLLAQVITVLSQNIDPRMLTPELVRCVRREGWAHADASHLLECIICYNRLRNPLTTPCGHTFCRSCIKRTIKNTGRCALCCRPLDQNFTKMTSENRLVTAVLNSMPVTDLSTTEPDFVIVFNCTTAFPSVACHISITEQHSCQVVRRMLDTGSRLFGVVNSEFRKKMYGTLVEVKDCVLLENGTLLLASVGLTRFKILEKITVDRIVMARIEVHTDYIPEMTLKQVEFLNRVKLMIYVRIATLVYFRLGRPVREHIEAWLGPIPRGIDSTDTQSHWWEKPEGADWLWWIIAVLPLQNTLLENVLSSSMLKQRLAIVAYSLQKLLEMSQYDYDEIVSEQLQMNEL